MAKRIAIMIMVIFLFCCLVGPVLTKDLNKGTLEVTGGSTSLFTSTDYKSDSGTEYKAESVAISLSSLYYLKRNIGLGLLVNHSDRNELHGTNKITSTSTIYGPLVGMNFSVGEKDSVKGLVSAFVGKGEYKNDNPLLSDVTNDITGWQVIGSFNHYFTDTVSGNVFAEHVRKSYSGGGVSGQDTDVRDTTIGLGLSIYLR
ncbi:MAG: hypothetical protein OEZ47_16970 [Gammaproteobacteria bacterium]|nr:hypothetical protein [Gammaproteobacteria bacterium]